jgi:hypothetical protein
MTIMGFFLLSGGCSETSGKRIFLATFRIGFYSIDSWMVQSNKIQSETSPKKSDPKHRPRLYRSTSRISVGEGAWLIISLRTSPETKN